MARRRGVVGRILSGASTLVGQLAQFFRLGRMGAVQPPEEAEPGRARLTTPQEVVSALSESRRLPTQQQGARVSASYIVTFIDRETGETHGVTRIQVEADEGTSRSTLDSRARRDAMLALPRYMSAEMILDRSVQVRVRRLSSMVLPPQP